MPCKGPEFDSRRVHFLLTRCPAHHVPTAFTFQVSIVSCFQGVFDSYTRHFKD